MTTIDTDIVINQKPEAIFDFCSDMTHELEWNPKAKKIEKTTDGPVGKGTKYKAKWQGGPEVLVECVSYDRPKIWVNHNGGALEVISTFRLTPQGDATLLQTTFEVQPHGIMKLLFPLMKSGFEKQFPQNLAAIKRHFEGTQTAA